ncbi:MAG: hypothetical protein ABIL01_11735, partial [Pseudomonadota bacterium]
MHSLLKRMVPIILMAPMLAGCSHTNTPTSPDSTRNNNRPESVGEFTQSDNTRHFLWSYELIYIDSTDPENIIFESTPIRGVANHWNILSWLEKFPCSTCFKLVKLTQQGNNTWLVGIRIVHPFTDASFTGFDVRGIAIFNASHEFPISGLTFSDNNLGDCELINADGYSTLYNGETMGGGPGGLQGYIKGKLASSTPPNGLLNGYKRFITADSANTRNAFYTGTLTTVTYEIRKTPEPIMFAYAVDACWAPPLEKPVTDPMTQFPPEANCEEPWKITVDCDPIISDTDTLLTAYVYDWQGKSTYTPPTIECPELFDGELVADWKQDSTGFSSWQVSVPNAKSAPPGSYKCLVKVVANENDPVNKPWLDLTAYRIAEITVVSYNGWARTWGGIDEDKTLDVAIGENDSVYTTGYFNGTADFDPGPTGDLRASNGGNDVFLSKLSSDGSYLWCVT